jgi:transcriptional regulator with XRE-family HTH domain
MLQIDSEFKSLIPKLSVDEYALLEESILAEGCRDALIVWNDVIIDGHNRYEICQKHNIPFNDNSIAFDSRDDAKIWIIDNQRGRRNLSLYDSGILALRKKEILAKQAKENQGTRTDILVTLPKSEPINTREQLADEAGMSGRTLDKIEKIHKESTPEIIQSIRDGDLTINKAYNYLKREEVKEQAKTIEQILIFGKRTLQILFEGNKYPEIENSRKTSKGFLLPLVFAKERVAIKYIEIQPELQLAGG